MATFLDGVQTGWWYRTDNYVYGKLTGNVSRSGNTVTLSGMVLTLTARYSSSGSEAQSFTVHNTQTNFTVSASGTNLGTYSLNNTSFSVTTTQTSANVGWASSDGYSGLFNVTFPSGVSAPTGLNVSNVVVGTNSFTATVSITGWGVGSGTRSRELQVWTNGMVEPRRFQGQTGDSLTGSITCNNSSSGTLTITPNTMYTIGGYATNGQANTGSQNFGNYTTLPSDLQSKSAVAINTHSIKINYTTRADGGKYAKKIQYSLNNSTWVDGATVSSGSATSGSFNITGLRAGTQYTVYLRISTTAGITTSGSVTAKTKTSCKIIRGNRVIGAVAYVIKPNGTKVELNVRKI